MKQLLVWFGLFLALILVGCSGGGDDAPNSSASPTNSVQLIELDTIATGNSAAVVMDGDYVYVADLEQGVLVFYLEGNSLVQIGAIDLKVEADDPDAQPWSLAKSGDYLYVAAKTSLYVVNVSAPDSPTLTPSRITTLGFAYSVFIKGNKLCLCDDNSLRFFSLAAHPDMPEELGAYDDAVGGITGVVVAGDYAYVSSWGDDQYPDGSLIFLNISSASTPRLIGIIESQVPMFSLASYGDFLLAGGDGSGLVILNSQGRGQNVFTAVLPTSPYWNPPDGDQVAYQIVVKGHYAYIADGNNGISVVDIRDVTDPRLVARVKTGGNVWGVAVDGDLLVATDVITGVHLFRINEVQDPVSSPTNRFAVIQTNYGLIKLELREDLVPLTTNNFILLAQSGFYNGLIFHRVIEGFMNQGGAPIVDGSGGLEYSIPDEFPHNGHGQLLLTHDSAGILSMANSGPDTGNSQFFITVAPTPLLDGVHTIFGRVVEGLDVVQAINAVPTNGDTGDVATSYRPNDPVVIERITITTE